MHCTKTPPQHKTSIWLPLSLVQQEYNVQEYNKAHTASIETTAHQKSDEGMSYIGRLYWQQQGKKLLQCPSQLLFLCSKK
jgi:hypothetical protein